MIYPGLEFSLHRVKLILGWARKFYKILMPNREIFFMKPSERFKI